MKKIWLYILAMTGLSVHVGFAKITTVNSYEKFNQLINAKQLCVAYFYSYVHSCGSKQEKTQHKEQLEIFKATSCVQNYKSADVSFLVVNVAQPKLTELHADYELSKMPTFVLFKDGSPYEACGNMAVIEGCATKAELMALLDDNVSQEIKEIIAYKEEVRCKELQETLLWYNYYGFPWYGYCRPWYGYGCGPYGGCGYGGGCYNGYGCGPYVNFGIGFCN